MNREQIRQSAIARMARIEDRHSSYVSPEIMQWYFLNVALCLGVEKFIESQGLQPIDECSCDEGKVMEEGNELTAFERDCIEYLNNIIFEREQVYDRRKQIGIVQNFHR